MQSRTRRTSSGARWTSMPTPKLRQKCTDHVPAVFIDGRKAFKYRMDSQRVKRIQINQIIAEGSDSRRKWKISSVETLPIFRPPWYLIPLTLAKTPSEPDFWA
jgi:hypothetical protein